MMQDESESLPEALMSKSSCSPFFSPQLQFPFCLFSRWFETKSSLSFAYDHNVTRDGKLTKSSSM